MSYLKAKVLKEIVGTHFWKHENGFGGSQIYRESADNRYELFGMFNHYLGQEYIAISLYVNQKVKSIEYLYQLIFTDLDEFTLSYSTAAYRLPISKSLARSQKIKLDSAYESRARSIWSEQYSTELSPLIRRYEKLGEIQKEDKSLGAKYGFIIGGHISKRLILNKLVSQSLYEYSLTGIDDFISVTLQNPKWADDSSVYLLFDKIKKLESLLNELDVKEYLRVKPWISEITWKETIGAPIVLGRTAMLVISTKVTVNYIKKCVGFNELIRLGSVTIEEASQISNQDVDLIDFVNWNNSTIVFLHGALVYDAFKIVVCSEAKSVLRFSVDDTSNSFRYELYEDGVMKVMGIELDGEVREYINSGDITLEVGDPEDVIRALFRIVCKRDLNELSAALKVDRYKFI